jgi:hypothetical protein
MSRIVPMVLLLWWLLPGGLASQYMPQGDKKTRNYQNFSNKPYYFGITLGYNTSGYKVFRSDDFILNDSITSISSPRGPGFNLGIVTNLKMGEDFDLRFLPTLSFADRRISYTTLSGVQDVKRIESVFVELPFHVRYKSKIYRDFRLFVLGGAKFTFDLASNSRSRQAAQLIKVAATDYQLEYGFGIQVFFPYFIFSPEIKFSHGLGNGLIYDRDLIYSRTLDKLLPGTITISLHFEG